MNWEILKSPRNIAVIAILAIVAMLVARKLLAHPATNGEPDTAA